MTEKEFGKVKELENRIKSLESEYNKLRKIENEIKKIQSDVEKYISKGEVNKLLQIRFSELNRELVVIKNNQRKLFNRR